MLQSSDLGRRVIDELNLASKPEFNSLLAGLGPVSRLKLALGFGEDPRLKTPEQRALGRYADELTVYQQPNSNVIAVEFSSTNPETAAAVANTLSKTYIQWTRESQAQPTERARDWLSAQIDELRQKLARSEEAVEKFRAEAGLLQGATTTLGTQEISELNTQITLARAASTEARARADSIRDLLNSKGSVDASSDVLASAAVQRLKEQRSDAARRLAELSATYLPGHPKMVAAQGEVNSVDRQIRSEALKVVTSLEEQARVADAREKSLRESLDRLKSAEASANIDDVKLKALEREASADRALLETMLSRFAEASSRQDQSAQPGMARIIQSASVPSTPSFPKRGPIVLLMTLAGAALAIGLAIPCRADVCRGTPHRTPVRTGSASRCSGAPRLRRFLHAAACTACTCCDPQCRPAGSGGNAACGTACCGSGHDAAGGDRRGGKPTFFCRQPSTRLPPNLRPGAWARPRPAAVCGWPLLR